MNSSLAILKEMNLVSMVPRTSKLNLLIIESIHSFLWYQITRIIARCNKFKSCVLFPIIKVVYTCLTYLQICQSSFFICQPNESTYNTKPKCSDLYSFGANGVSPYTCALKERTHMVPPIKFLHLSHIMK